MFKARDALEANWLKGPKAAGKAIYLSGHTDSVYCVQFDEEKIITGSRDRTIRVWDINNFYLSACDWRTRREGLLQSESCSERSTILISIWQRRA